MSRRVVTTSLQAAGGGPADTYFDKVVKYIPADVIAAWVAAEGAIKAASHVPESALLWGVFAFLLVLTPLWTLRQTAAPGMAPARTQALIAAGAFAVWIFAIGGPFARVAAYRPLYGTLGLIAYTFLVAVVNPDT